MKKKIIAVLLMCTFLSLPVMAGGNIMQLEQVNYPISVNGVLIDTSAFPVLNLNGSTYVPLRLVSEALGSSVNWDDADKTIDIIGRDSWVEYNMLVSNLYMRFSALAYSMQYTYASFESDYNLYIDGSTADPFPGIRQMLDNTAASIDDISYWLDILYRDYFIDKELISDIDLRTEHAKFALQYLNSLFDLCQGVVSETYTAKYLHAHYDEYYDKYKYHRNIFEKDSYNLHSEYMSKIFND